MEYRKLISFGKSSYVVSLPKPWVRHNKLKKGDLIYIDEKENSLMLSPRPESKDEHKKIIINVDGKDIYLLQRELISAYIGNYRKITFNGKELAEKSEKLLDLIRKQIALEVIELDSNQIVAKDFLNMDEVSVVELIHKMDLIVRYMLKDTSKSFTEKNASNIALRDDDVNRLSFLVYRVVRYGLNNQSKFLKIHNLGASDLFNSYWITLHLEIIADESKRSSRIIETLSLSKKHRQEFIEILNHAEEFYIEAMKCYYNNDTGRAFELSTWKNPLMVKIDQFVNMLKGDKDIIGISNLSFRMKRMVGSIHELQRFVYQK